MGRFENVENKKHTKSNDVRRNEIHENYKTSHDKYTKGKLDFSEDIKKLKKML